MPSAAESLVESDDRKVLAGFGLTEFDDNDFRFYRLPVFSELLHWKVTKALSKAPLP